MKLYITSLLVVFCHFTKIAAQATSANVWCSQPTPWADSVLQTLSLDQKIGQLFMVAAWSDEKKESYNPTQIENLVKQYGIGGVIFFQGGPVRQAKLTNKFQRLSKIPLLIGIDAEWGLGMRLDSTISYPRQMTLGAIRDKKIIYTWGTEVARQLKRIGVHMNFAPVVDVNSNPKNPVILNRSFGENKVEVYEASLQYMKGMQDAGVLANAKHFPGHGDTDVDSHKDLPVVNKSLEELMQQELWPYQPLFKEGLASIMVAHLSLPQLETEPHVPSTLSKNIITNILRNQMKFDGLVLTDAMNMSGVAKYFPAGEADVRALIAGNDIVLFPLDVPLAIKKVKEAIANGRLTEKEITEKARKVLMAKEMAGANKFKPIPLNSINADLNNGPAIRIKRELIEASITQLGSSMWPLNNTVKLGVCVVGDDADVALVKGLKKFYQVEALAMSKNADDAKMNEIVASFKSKGVKHVLVAYLGTNNKASENFGVVTSSIAVAEKIGISFPTSVAVFGCPYILNSGKWKGLTNFIVAYQADQLTQFAVANALGGTFDISGKLPVSAGVFKEGEGVISIGNKSEKEYPLEYTGLFNVKSKSNSAGNNSAVYQEDMMGNQSVDVVGKLDQVFSKIDALASEGIAQGAYPGCAIRILKDGMVVYDKQFGSLNYDGKVKVNSNTVYDLASITKMLASGLAIMKLVDLGKIDINATLGDYLEFPSNHPHAKLQLKKLYAHTAGLPAWRDFVQLTMLNGEWKGECLSKEHSDLCCNPVAQDMFTTKEMTERIYGEILKVDITEGQGYKYSDIGYYYHKKIIEKLSGKSLDLFLNENFYYPMGLETVGFKPSERIPIQQIAETENDTKWRKQVVKGFVH
ncbi:MAG: glycoside hydrolase family 3 N-terminal domain-containing protein, partial [Bacteroidota bacterium]